MSVTERPSQMYRKRNWIFGIIGLATSALFLWLALRNVNYSELSSEIAKASIGILILTQATKLIGFYFLTIRSFIMLKPLRIYSLRVLFKSIFVSFVGNNVLPMRMGEILRIGYLANHGKLPATSCLAVVMTERMLDTFCLLLILFCMLAMGIAHLPITGSLYVAAALIVCVMFIFITIAYKPGKCIVFCQGMSRIFGSRISRSLNQKIERFVEGLSALSSFGVIIAVIMLTIGYLITNILTVQLWLLAFDVSLPWYVPIVVMLFIAFGLALPSSPGYIGTYHYFAIMGLQIFGVMHTQATSIVLVGHALAIVPFTVLGIFLLSGEYVKFTFKKRLSPIEIQEKI